MSLHLIFLVVQFYLKKLNLQITREINLSEEDWNNLSSTEIM